MLNPITFLKKPEYFFRPSKALQHFRRVWYPPQAVDTTRLPWGLPVMRIAENIGSLANSYRFAEGAICYKLN
jgi:hypothetical protein